MHRNLTWWSVDVHEDHISPARVEQISISVRYQWTSKLTYKHTSPSQTKKQARVLRSTNTPYRDWLWSRASTCWQYPDFCTLTSATDWILVQTEVFALNTKAMCVGISVCVGLCVDVGMGACMPMYVCVCVCGGGGGGGGGMCSDFQSIDCGFDSRRLWSHTSFFSFSDSSWLFFHSPGWLPTASACRSMWCDVCAGKKKKKKNEKTKNRDSLARKCHSK